MISFFFLAYALAHGALFVWALRLLLQHRHVDTVPVLIVLFGLVYDNAVLAGGTLIGHGGLLERLSIPRFFLHAFGTPLLMLSALGLVQRCGANWARSSGIAIGVTTLTLVMIAVGVAADLVGLHLVAKDSAGVVSYGNASAFAAPVAPLVTVLILLTAGVIVWRHSGGPWLLIGAIVQLLAGAISGAMMIVGNFGELALLAALIVTDARVPDPRRDPQAPARDDQLNSMLS
jgi:hypothetical protein